MTARRMDGMGVFVAGGSRGLGFAIADEALARGANVAICARNADALTNAVERLRRTGVSVLPLQADAHDRSQMERAVRAAASRFGRLDLLVYNAGTIQVGPAETMTQEDYEEAMGTHFWGAYYAVESALPIFRREGGGRIALISSIGGKVSVPHLLPYCASKFALTGYGEGLRAALARSKVTVTTVCPGLMRTGSPPNAWFKGQNVKEYAWFAISDSLPGLSMDAQKAARKTLDAVLRGDAEIVLGLPAKLLAFAHGIAPNLTARVMGLGARLLPGPGGIGTEKERGRRSTSGVTESPLTALTRQAEDRFNQR